LGAAVGVGAAVFADLASGKLDRCHTSVQALINAVLGCASGVLLGNITKASLWLVDALRKMGFGTAANALYHSPQFRKWLVGVSGVGIGSVAGFSDEVANIICDYYTEVEQGPPYYWDAIDRTRFPIQGETAGPFG
jgi:hypothetical protein